MPILIPLFHIEEEWEKELEAELQDYEVVGEHKFNPNKNENWEREIEEMLENEADLKWSLFWAIQVYSAVLNIYCYLLIFVYILIDVY